MLIIYNITTTEQLTRAFYTEAVSGVSHDPSFIIRPVKLTEFPTQGFVAVFLSMFVTFVMKTLVRELLRILHFTFSTTESFHPIYLLRSFTFSQVSPVTPPPIFDLLAEGQIPLAVGLYQLVAQSLASVGLLDILDTELGFLVYRTEKKITHRIRLSGLNISFYLKRP